jgi:tryptophan halogenase
LKNITIVGGGSAGWMTATTLLNQFPDKKITLVESPNAPTVGVGESTVAGDQTGFAGIVEWLKLNDINDSDWMPHCDGLHKLSIAFENWYREDSGTFHFPFGPPRGLDSNTNFQANLNDWHLKKIFYPETPLSDYAESFYPGMALINQNKALHYNKPILAKDELGDSALTAGWSFQFDATKFGIWLRDYYCKAKYSDRFTHIQAEVLGVPLNEDGIKYLILDNGEKLKGDLFIDCTGFKSLLLTETFEVPFNSIEDFIPNNYAWATKIPYKDPETQIVNYTNCAAIENGWIWEIPLWSRMGAGYVFSDKFISTDAALREFKFNLIKKGYENANDLDYHLIPMRCGVQSKLWVKNTCAIGLAAGFVEPLQSTGLQSIHQFLFNLCRILERGHISEWDRREFTTKCHDDFYAFTSLVALLYVLSHRDDTEYWRDIQNRDYPENIFLQQNEIGISKFFSQMYIEKNFHQSFNPNNAIHCLAAGMNWNPIDKLHHLLKDVNKEQTKLYVDYYIQQTEERKKQWNEEIKDFPSLYQYSKDTIHI